MQIAGVGYALVGQFRKNDIFNRFFVLWIVADPGLKSAFHFADERAQMSADFVGPLPER